VGDIFAGHRIEGVAGRGGMGVVYRATQLDLERPVALKLIAPQLAQDPSFRERFVRESRIAAAIDHPHVIPIYYAGEQDGALYLAMRYVDGEDLRAIVRRDGMLEPDRAARIVSQLGGALDAAHARGLVHRDVKPANVLLTGDDHAYLTDFGLSKRVLDTSGLSRSGQWVGTLGYVAPEQIRGLRVDARTDVFALGCVLFFGLTGATPFQRESDEATLWAHLNDPPEPVDVLAPGVPAAFGAVLERALAKDPDDRFQSAGDLGRAALAAAGETVTPGPERGAVARGAAAPGDDDETIVPGATPSSATGVTTLSDDSVGRRRRRLAALGLLAVAAVAGVTIAIVLSAGGGGPKTATTGASRPTTASSTSTATTTENPGMASVKVIPTGLERPNSIAILGSTVWVSANPSRHLVSFDRQDAARGKSVPKSAGTATIAPGFGSLWVLNVKRRTLGRLRAGSTQIRLATDRLTDRTGPGIPVLLDTGADSVWVGVQTTGSGVPDQIERIETGPVHSKVIGGFPVPNGLLAMTVADRTVWIVNKLAPQLERFVLRTGSTRAVTLDAPQDVAAGSHAVYVTEAGGTNELVEVDPVTLRKTILGATGLGPTALAVHGSDIWVVANDGTVTHFNAQSGTIGTPEHVCAQPFDVAADADGAWIVCVSGVVVRVKARAG
jgi:Protein kinase domain